MSHDLDLGGWPLAPYPGPRPPETKKIWVIVPFSRSAHLDRVLANFMGQRFEEKRLILVENGEALNYTQENYPDYLLNGWDIAVLQSEAHQSAAKNVALDYIRKQGGGFFTTMDDDDWYGPGHLDEIAGYAKTATVIGKQGSFTSVGDKLLCTNARQVDREVLWLTGGTISGWAEDSLVFNEKIKDGSDDVEYCSRMLEKGGAIRALSPYHYLYRRSYPGANHAFKLTEGQFLQLQTRRRALEFAALDYAVITGERRPNFVRLLGREHFEPVADLGSDAVPSRA